MNGAALYNIGDFVEFVHKPPKAEKPEPKVWFMLRCHPNHDLLSERRLADRGAYCPKEIKILKTGRNRRQARTVPVFPGCLFVPDWAADLARLKAIAPGIGGFVKTAKEALRISPAIMAEIRDFEARLDPTRRKFKVGQRVRIKSGPFEMLEAKIDRLDSRYRLRVLIQILISEAALEIDEDQVEAVG